MLDRCVVRPDLSSNRATPVLTSLSAKRRQLVKKNIITLNYFSQEFYNEAYNDLNYLLQYEQTQEYAQAKINELDKIIPPEE